MRSCVEALNSVTKDTEEYDSLRPFFMRSGVEALNFAILSSLYLVGHHPISGKRKMKGMVWTCYLTHEQS